MDKYLRMSLSLSTFQTIDKNSMNFVLKLLKYLLQTIHGILCLLYSIRLKFLRIRNYFIPQNIRTTKFETKQLFRINDYENPTKKEERKKKAIFQNPFYVFLSFFSFSFVVSVLLIWEKLAEFLILEYKNMKKILGEV